MRGRTATTCSWIIAVVALAATAPSGAQDAPAGCEGTVDGRSIAYVGAVRDVADLQAADLGRSGSWFPQVAAPVPVEARPTGEGARDALPEWVAPFTHFPEDPDFGARTFSQDGPARSAGGQPGWDSLTLPDGEVVASGAIVDPATIDNTNNTINRIQLRGEVPPTFYLSVVTDNTNREHDPTLVRARGNVGPDDLEATQVEPDGDAELAFDGRTDVYTFRYDGFAAGDYLKVRLRGDPAPSEGASIGGLLLDERVTADAGTPAPDCGGVLRPSTGGPDEPPPPGAPPAPPSPAGPARPVAAPATFTG